MRRLVLQPTTLGDLPAEVLAVVLAEVYKNWCKASRVKLVASWLAGVARDVQRHAPLGWWTGNRPPLRVPPPLPINNWCGNEHHSHLISTIHQPASPGDLARLERDEGWLNNFAIALVVKASPYACSLLSPQTCIPALRTYGMQGIVDPGLASSLYMNLINIEKLVQEKRGVLSDTNYLTCLCECDVLLWPINTDNQHWILARIVKAHRLVELFLWLGTAHEEERARVYLAPLVRYLRAMRVLDGDIRVVAHVSPGWKQDDGSSCGVFTLVAMFNLLEGRQLNIAEPNEWRKYLTSLVKSKANI